MSAPGRTLRVGVLGAGRIAVRRMMPAMSRCPRITVAAVASRDPARAAEVARTAGARVAADYDELLARDDLDAIYIALPAALHVPWTRAALSAGRHVLVEKPLAVDAAGAREVTELAAKQSLTVLESFAFLHHPQHEAVRRAVGAGEIGTLRSMTADFAFPPLPPGDIRYAPGLGGGALLDAGVYTLRTASLFLGGDVRVVGASLRYDPDSGVDVAGAVLVEAADGRTGQLSFGFTHAYRSAYSLWGSTGRLTLERAFAPPPARQPVLRIETQDLVREITLAAADQFDLIAAHFADAVLDGADPAPAYADAVRQASLIDAVRAAAANREAHDVRH